MFQDKTLERLVDRIGKNTETLLPEKHNSLVEELLNSALEKDILLSRCKDFDKLAVSPMYNSKLLQEYISSKESSLYSEYIRHYIPLAAPKMREKFLKPSLSLVFAWVKDNLLNLTLKDLEKSIGPMAAGIGVDLASIMEELHDRFKTLHPEAENGIIKNDDLIAKISEIATDISYYTGLDNEIRRNLENIKKESGLDYAIKVSSRLKNDPFFTEIKNRGYFLESELATLKDILPLLLCPSATCPDGFFNETLESCNKKQREIIRQMIMDLQTFPVQSENLPENSITFEAFLRYIISISIYANK